MRITGAALALVCGCTEEKFYSSGLATPIAVGATATGAIYSSSCTKIDKHVDCEIPSVSSTYKLTPAGVFSLDSSAARYTVTAHAEGVATLSIESDNGSDTKTFTHRIEARPIDNVVVTTVDGRAVPCEAPPRYQAGTKVQLSYELRHGETPLNGVIFPFEATGATIAQSTEYDRVLDLMMPATPDPVTLTSAADPAFSLTVRAFTPDQVDGISFDDVFYPLTVTGSGATTTSVHLADGATVCGNQLSRTTTVLTPDTCRVFMNNPVGMMSLTSTSDHIQIMGLKAGTCSLSVTLDGTSITATRDFPVLAK
jgi:hypothetical protein